MSNKPSFTPGPWDYDEDSNEVRAADGTAIVDMDTGLAWDTVANARLIAAAPELVEAVEMVLDACEDGGDMDAIDWDQLRNALAKAKGGT